MQHFVSELETYICIFTIPYCLNIHALLTILKIVLFFICQHYDV